MNGLRTMRIKDVRIIVDEDTYNEMRGQKLSVTKTGRDGWVKLSDKYVEVLK